MKSGILKFHKRSPSRLYYTDKKTQKRKRISDNIYRDLQCVTRANDPNRKIPLKVRNLLGNLLEMILKSPHKEIFVDHDFLSSITEVYSSKQNKRLLDQISDILDSTYHSCVNFHGKRRTYGYIIKLTEDGYKRARNPEAFYGDSSGQKCPVDSTKMSTYIKIEEYTKEVEEIAFGYISSTKEENKIKEESIKPIILANSSLTELASELVFDKISIQKLPPNQPQEEGTLNSGSRSLSVPYGAAPCLSENSSELTSSISQEKEHYGKHKVSGRRSNNQPTSLTLVLATMPDIPIAANQNDEDTSIHHGQQKDDAQSTAIVNQNTASSEEVVVNIDKSTKLQQEIFKSFNPKTSEGIMENCTFTELEPNKLGISLQSKFKLPEEEKGKLRTCIRMIYGNDVKMVSTTIAKREVSANEKKQQEQQPRPSANSQSQWDKFKVKIAEYYPENQYNHVMNAWLEHLRYSHSSPDKIVVVGRSFYVDEIYQRFTGAIEEAVIQTKKSIEIQYEGNAQKPIEFDYNKLNQRR